MAGEIFDRVQAAALRMGSCDPNWLRARSEPQFITKEQGASGPPMILLHGLFGAMSNWDSIFPLFTEFTQTINMHFPLLTAHRSEVRVKALAAFTEYFIRKRNLAPAVLCGNSLGGHVALRLCLASPEMVDCLVLAGPSGLYEHSVDTLPVRPDSTFVREHMERVFYSRRFITEAAVQEISAILANRVQTLNLIHAARSAKRDNLLELLKEIKVPTLLLWGENDQVTTMQVAEMFHKNIPDCELITKSECGHAPMIEYPEWFSEEVRKFLQRRSKYFAKK